MDTHLWVLALQYFAREESGHRSQYIHKILEQVDHYNLLPPLVVIEILSKSRYTKLGDVKVCCIVLTALQDYTAVCWGVLYCTYCTAGLHGCVLGCAVLYLLHCGLHGCVLGCAVLYLLHCRTTWLCVGVCCIVLTALQDYIAGKLHTENDAIARDEHQIKNYQKSTQHMKEQLEELRTKARVFQVMKCETCKSGLRLPAVHFLCQHSYHLRYALIVIAPAPLSQVALSLYLSPLSQVALSLYLSPLSQVALSLYLPHCPKLHSHCTCPHCPKLHSHCTCPTVPSCTLIAPAPLSQVALSLHSSPILFTHPHSIVLSPTPICSNR